MRFASTAAALAFAMLVFGGHANAADIYEGDRGGSLKDPIYAPPASVYYVAIRGGATFAEDTDFEVLGLDVDNEYDDVGYMISGAVGMSMAGLTGIGGLRGEVELGYLENEIDQHVIAGAPVGSEDSFGETSAFYGLVNLYYDFNHFGRIKPFIGGGIGFAHVDFDDHGTTATDVVLSDDNNGFAYQLSAGANIAVSESVDIELGYRYMGITDVELEAVDGTASDIDVDNHIVYGGLRFKM